MRSRRVACAAALVAVASLSGCGGPAEPSDEPSAEPSSTPTSSISSSAAESPSEGAAGGYLPVPAGVTLTEPGTELALKDAAVAAWEPRQGLVGVVDVTVARISVTTVKKSLRDFDLTDAQQASTPYFVQTVVANAGDTDLGARQLPVYLLDSQGGLVPPTGVDPAFEACPGSTLPAIFAPGDKARSCLVFLVPEGRDVQLVMFRPPEGVVPLTWTGQVVALAKPGDEAGDTSGGKNKGKRGGKGS
ncbi:hypothetical protein BH11ACT8_BH11ACT8_31150 [soil metagenome]